MGELLDGFGGTESPWGELADSSAVIGKAFGVSNGAGVTCLSKAFRGYQMDARCNGFLGDKIKSTKSPGGWAQ